MSSTLIWDLAEELRLAALSLLGVGAPAITYTGLTDPVDDCPEQLVVFPGRIGLASTQTSGGGLGDAQRGRQIGTKTVVDLYVRLTRCTPPTVDPANVAAYVPEIASAAQQVIEDMIVVHRGIPYLIRTGSLWTSLVF
jgi:hypothetical protein